MLFQWNQCVDSVVNYLPSKLTSTSILIAG